ncbi:four helix bundle protein [Porticoccus sp. GXU_MW_L64]
MREYEKLHIWQDAMELVTDIYLVTGSYPEHEKFGLLAQLRRAAVSIPSNIAEGRARESNREFIRFLLIARGSVAEVETQLHISANLGYAKEIDWLLQKTDRIFAKTTKLINKLRSLDRAPGLSSNVEHPTSNTRSTRND